MDVTIQKMLDIGFLPTPSGRIGGMGPAYKLWEQSGAEGNVAMVLGWEGCTVRCTSELTEAVNQLETTESKCKQNLADLAELEEAKNSLKSEVFRCLMTYGVSYHSVVAVDLKSGEKVCLDDRDAFTGDIITYKVLYGNNAEMIRNFSREVTAQMPKKNPREFLSAFIKDPLFQLSMFMAATKILKK